MANPFKPITEKLADRVWRHAGDLRQAMNVYFLREEDGGITIFDGGTRSMTERARQAAEQLGPIRRIDLGHSHADHRGIPKGNGAPVHSHPDERADAEGDGGYHYFDLDRIPFRIPRKAYPRLLAYW
jgi:glyoxylase-like metal-dependent hydrolase (beta-lactamase superfamily II)